MFARSLGPRARRRGIVLVLILGMLGLVALIGVTFATFAGQSLKGSRDFMQGVARPSGEVLMDYALAQLINDTSNPMSALRGHSLLRDMYGNDSVFRGADPNASNAGATRGFLDRVYIGGTPTQLQLTKGVAIFNTTAGTPFYNQSVYLTNIPAYGQYFGLNFTRWILTFPANNAVNYQVAQTFEILDDTIVNDATLGDIHQFTLSNNLGNPIDPTQPVLPTYPSGTGRVITSIDEVTNIWNNPNLTETATPTRTQIGLSGITPTAFPVTGFTLNAQYMRAFNGPGMTRPDYPLVPDTSTTPATPATPYPHNFAAYGNFRLNGLDPDAVGMDEDYDACDLENWFLAIQSADGQVIIPSFHRPGILMAGDWTAAITNNTGDVSTKQASKILRPRQGDHSPLFPPNPVPDATATNGGKITYDIDNDGDGVTDSVWLDLGYPVQRDPGGKLYKPLFAFMVLGLNGRMPLNTVGNLQARADGNGTVSGTGTVPGTDPAKPPSMTGDPVAVSQAGAYPADTSLPYPYNTANSPLFVSQTWADAPLWDHASHLGYSVNEINPKYALQNAPANVTRGAVAGNALGLFPLAGVSYSQNDNSGVDVALTQLRNILAGTVPTDLKNPVTVALNTAVNQDTNVVAVDGSPWVLPNNVFDPNDNGWNGKATDSMVRPNGVVPGRWGEPEGIPTQFARTSDLFLSAFPNTAIAQFTNPVRAGRSHYVGGVNDIMDDDFDSVDPLLAQDPLGTVPRNYPEDIDSFDASGQRSVATERMRLFRTPVDPSATGRMVGYMQRPVDAHDRGLGFDNNGRVGFFRYFRPAGLPQDISYPYTTNTTNPTDTTYPTEYNKPLFQPASGSARSINSLNGISQAMYPGNIPGTVALPIDPQNRNVAVMGSMPFDWKQDTVPAPPVGYSPTFAVPTINPNVPINTKINSDWGPNLGTSSPGYVAVGATGPFGTYNNASNLGVVNGYLGGSLNKDEADEMNLYTPSLSDQPFGPSDLEWLYRKHDVDGASLSSRLSSLAPVSFLNPADGLTRRRLFSTDSWEPISFVYAHDNPSGYAFEQINYKSVPQPRFQFNSRFSPRASASLYAMNQVAILNSITPGSYTKTYSGLYDYAYNYYTHANPIATEFYPNPTLPMRPNPKNSATSGTSISNYIPNLAATPVVFPVPLDNTSMATSVFTGEKNPSNASPYQLSNGGYNYSALGSSGVPVETPTLAHRDRRINLNFPLPTSNDPAEPVRQKWIRETYQLLKAILPPQSVDTPQELAALSQYVVNIVDFRDPDATATRFVNTDLETDAAQDDQPAGVRFSNTAPPVAKHQPFDPHLYDPDAATPTPYLVQHGMEYTPLAINEILAYSTQSGTTDNNRLYIELVNTLTDDEAAGNNSDIDLEGWDIVVTPDAYGWGRPDPITGEVTPVALGPVTPVASAGAPPKPKSATTAPTDPREHRVNGGTGLPGYIFGRPAPLPADNPTLVNSNLTGRVRVPAITNTAGGGAGRQFFILANEAAYTGNVGSGTGASPGGETAPIQRYGATGGTTEIIDGLFPDYVLPFGPYVTASGATLTYTSAGRVNTDPSGTAFGKYYWVYLRRPANPFDRGKLTDAKPNREMVVVDSMRFTFVEPGTTNVTSPPLLLSSQRLQPYRGGHLVPTDTAHGTGAAVGANPTISAPVPRGAYGYSEQSTLADTSSGSTNTATVTGITTPLPIQQTLGADNESPDNAWLHLPFHDRDFTSVAELLLVPGCPPGLFTKQFAEEPYPGNVNLTAYDNADLPFTTAPSVTNFGRRNFRDPAASSTAVLPTYPYLPDSFYYTAASIAPPETPVPASGPDPGMTQIPTEVGGWTGAGWFKMFEFFEVPSSAAGATGLAANGVDFDWYRSDVKPGLMNLNLIIDEEAFFGILDDDRLNRKIAADITNYPNNDNTYYLPSVVTQINSFGYPDVLDNTKTPYVMARYPISDINLTTVNPGVGTTGPFGRGFVYRDPAGTGALIHGLKSAFSDFLKIRHGGSGYLFAFGSGASGSGGYIESSQLGTYLGSTSTHTPTPVAAERPFRSLSFPDINYTIMRPASLPPSTLDINSTTLLPSWSYPRIPTTLDPVTGNPEQYNGTNIVAGLENLLSYAPDATAGNRTYVTLNPATPPIRQSTAYQYVFDPGLKNPYLQNQYNTTSNGAPRRPDVAPIPPTPARRLFQIADVAGSRTLDGPPVSNAGLFGAYNNTTSPAKFPVNEPTTDNALTSNQNNAAITVPHPAEHPAINPPTLVPPQLSVFMPDNQIMDTNPRENFLGGTTGFGTPVNNDNRQHPLYRTEWLQKVMNLTTVRTHQFAVWITIGFFEVVKQGTPELSIIDRLGGELNAGAGAKVRFRSFFVLDRTRAKGYNPYNPGEFRDVVTYRRRIE